MLADERVTPVLLFNTGDKDREACRVVTSARIDCLFVGSTTATETPILFANRRQYIGLGEIEAYLEALAKITP